MSNDARVDVLVDAIKELPDGQMKDALADDLKFAQDINGTKDPALKGIKRIVISGVRRELLAEERTKKAIEAHSSACQMKHLVKGKRGNMIYWLEILKPYRWPITIISFSPFAGDIVNKIIEAVK